MKKRGLVLFVLLLGLASCDADCPECRETDCGKCPTCYNTPCADVTCEQAPCVCEVCVIPDFPQPDCVIQPVEETKPEEVKPLKIQVTMDQVVLAGIVQVGAKVSGGAAIMGVEFYVDTQKIDQDLIPPYSTTVNTSEFPDGDHFLTAFTADSSGQNASSSIEVTFDNTPPSIVSTLPPADSSLFFEDGPLHMEMQVDDPMAIKHAEFRANGMLVAEFIHAPFTANAQYADLFVTIDSLPKNILLQYFVTDYLGQNAETSTNLVVHKRHAWTFPTVGEIWGSAVALSNGNIVFGNLNDTVFCLNPSGGQVWSYAIPGGDGDVMGAPTYDAGSGRIFVPTIGGVIYALNENGSQVWTKNIGTPLSGDLAYRNGTLYGNGYSGTVWALNPNNGSENWTAKINGNIIAGLAVGPDGKVFVGAQDKNLYAFENGSKLWDMPTGGEVWCTPAIGPDSTVYVGSNDGYVYAVSASGEKKWLKKIEGQLYARPMIATDGTLYVTDVLGYIARLNQLDGAVLWKVKLAGMTYSSPVQGPGGEILVGTNAGQVLALDPETGKVKWSYVVGGAIHATLLLNGGKIYFGSVDRNFYALWLTPP